MGKAIDLHVAIHYPDSEGIDNAITAYAHTIHRSQRLAEVQFWEMVAQAWAKTISDELASPNYELEVSW